MKCSVRLEDIKKNPTVYQEDDGTVIKIGYKSINRKYAVTEYVTVEVIYPEIVVPEIVVEETHVPEAAITEVMNPTPVEKTKLEIPDLKPKKRGIGVWFRNLLDGIFKL